MAITVEEICISMVYTVFEMFIKSTLTSRVEYSCLFIFFIVDYRNS